MSTLIVYMSRKSTDTSIHIFDKLRYSYTLKCISYIIFAALQVGSACFSFSKPKEKEYYKYSFFCPNGNTASKVDKFALNDFDSSARSDS